jgi:multisubunit Na+/H+ antiporter MnhE subunit
MSAQLGRQMAWVLFLIALWMLFVASTELPEVLLGVGSAVLASIGVAVLRKHAGLTSAPKLWWLGRALVLLPRFVTDTMVVFRALFRQLLGGQPALGAFRALPYTPGQRNLLSASAADAFVVAANSLTPNTIVLDADPIEGLLLVHQLVPQSHSDVSHDLIRSA